MTVQLPQENIVSETTIRTEFSHRGLIFLGAVDLDLDLDFERYQQWLEESDVGTMTYLRSNAELRKNPRSLMPEAKSAWIVAYNYYDGDKYSVLKRTKSPHIAQYARRIDYHRTLRSSCDDAMKELKNRISTFSSIKYRICVDTAPLLERALAAKTSNGIIAKNAMFVDRRFGSYLLLAVVLVDVELSAVTSSSEINPKLSVRSNCGSCKRCEVHCPTNALSKSYQIDPARCLAYWTIEHRGTVPFEFWQHFPLYTFGCDICQLVCPFNRIATPASTKAQLQATIDPWKLANLDQATYVSLFAGTPVTRAKLSGLRRNGIIVLAVKRDPRLQLLIDRRNEEADEVVRLTLEQAQDYLT